MSLFSWFLLFFWGFTIVYGLVKLRRLQRDGLNPVASALWVLIILLLPFLGILAFLIVFLEQEK